MARPTPKKRRARSPKRDWSRPLAKPIEVEGHELRTLHDVRAYLLKLPPQRQLNRSWQTMVTDITTAAEHGNMLDLTVPFMLAKALRH